jgi:hypothetical protein
LALDSGIDPDSGDLVHFTVDAERAEGADGRRRQRRRPELEARPFDEIDWTRWYDPS